MAIQWRVVISISQNNRQLALQKNASDDTLTDLNLLDVNDNVLGGVTLTASELDNLAILTVQAKAIKNLANA